MCPKPSDSSTAPTPSRQCPLCGSAMALTQRGVYTLIFECTPCRVAVQYPSERLPEDR